MNASVLHEASRLQKRANARVPLQVGKSYVLTTFPLICWPPQPMEQFVPAHCFLRGSSSRGCTVPRRSTRRLRLLRCAARRRDGPLLQRSRSCADEARRRVDAAGPATAAARRPDVLCRGAVVVRRAARRRDGVCSTRRRAMRRRCSTRRRATAAEPRRRATAAEPRRRGPQGREGN